MGDQLSHLSFSIGWTGESPRVTCSAWVLNGDKELTTTDLKQTNKQTNKTTISCVGFFFLTIFILIFVSNENWKTSKII